MSLNKDLVSCNSVKLTGYELFQWFPFDFLMKTMIFAKLEKLLFLSSTCALFVFFLLLHCLELPTLCWIREGGQIALPSSKLQRKCPIFQFNHDVSHVLHRCYLTSWRICPLYFSTEDCIHHEHCGLESTLGLSNVSSASIQPYDFFCLSI